AHFLMVAVEELLTGGEIGVASFAATLCGWRSVVTDEHLGNSIDAEVAGDAQPVLIVLDRRQRWVEPADAVGDDAPDHRVGAAAVDTVTRQHALIHVAGKGGRAGAAPAPVVYGFDAGIDQADIVGQFGKAVQLPLKLLGQPL